MKIKAVLVSHLHGDHILGLPGLVQTMSLNDRKGVLQVFGPSGTVRSWQCAMNMCDFAPGFTIEVIEVGPGASFKVGELTIDVASARHNIPSLAFKVSTGERPGRFDRHKAMDLGIPEGPLWGELQKGKTVTFSKEGKVRSVGPDKVLGEKRPGVSIVYSGDTAPCQEIMELSRGAQVLIHESTYGEELREMADGYGHSTARGAAEIARDAGVERLFLVHSSPRYSKDSGSEKLLEEAKAVFMNVSIPEDGEIIEINP